MYITNHYNKQAVKKKKKGGGGEEASFFESIKLDSKKLGRIEQFFFLCSVLFMVVYFLLYILNHIIGEGSVMKHEDMYNVCTVYM